MNIFHITVATLVGTMAVFGVTIAMAPSRGGDAAEPAPVAAPVATASQPAAARPLSWMDECVLVAVAQLPLSELPVAPGVLWRIRDHCAAQSIWREK